MHKKRLIVEKEIVIRIAMHYNCVSREIAEKYTDSELKEILHQHNIDAEF